MSRRVLVILLVVSLLFNFAVLIGFVKSRRDLGKPGGHGQLLDAPPPATMPIGLPPIARLANELRFDPSQSSALEDLQRRQQQQQTVFGDSLMVVRQDLQEELRKEQPDLERVRTLVDQEADLVRQRRQAETDLYGEFVALLTPQQRQQLGKRFAPPPRQRGPQSPDVVERFDRNKNGRLDPEEVKQARKELEGRRREVAPHVQQLPPLWPWFDSDGDGELNEAERAEMDLFLKDHHPPKAFPPPPQGPDGRPDGRMGPERRGPRGNPRPPLGPDGPPEPEGGDRPPPPPSDSQPHEG